MAYFTKEAVEFFHSGSQLLDCVLGGGWPVGRLLNIQGSSSSGKTLLTLEAANVHLQKYPNGKVYFADAEAAFDIEYATGLGMDLDKLVLFEGYQVKTVEDWFNQLYKLCEEMPSNEHGLFILDSLDALSDEAEMARLIDEATYGANKAKKLSEFFRKIIPTLAQKNMTTLVISQLRDAVNSKIPNMKIRSGGKAIEYYSSIVVRLETEGKIEKQHKGVKRAVGLEAGIKCTKNKVGMPFRSCTTSLFFGRGLDDYLSNLKWLADEVDGGLEGIEPLPDGTKIGKSTMDGFIKKLCDLPAEEQLKRKNEVALKVKTIWNEIEAELQGKVKIVGE